MFNSYTVQKVNTYIQTFLSLFLSKNFLSSILLLVPPTLSFPLPLYSLFLFLPHPYLSLNMARYLNSSTSSSFHLQTSAPPIPPSTSSHPHLQDRKSTRLNSS